MSGTRGKSAKEWAKKKKQRQQSYFSGDSALKKNGENVRSWGRKAASGKPRRRVETLKITLYRKTRLGRGGDNLLENILGELTMKEKNW